MDLPSEVVHMIALLLPSQDIGNLSATCRRMAADSGLAYGKSFHTLTTSNIMVDMMGLLSKSYVPIVQSNTKKLEVRLVGPQTLTSENFQHRHSAWEQFLEANILPELSTEVQTLKANWGQQTLFQTALSRVVVPPPILDERLEELLDMVLSRLTQITELTIILDEPPEFTETTAPFFRTLGAFDSSSRKPLDSFELRTPSHLPLLFSSMLPVSLTDDWPSLGFLSNLKMLSLWIRPFEWDDLQYPEEHDFADSLSSLQQLEHFYLNVYCPGRPAKNNWIMSDIARNVCMPRLRDLCIGGPGGVLTRDMATLVASHRSSLEVLQIADLYFEGEENELLGFFESVRLGCQALEHFTMSRCTTTSGLTWAIEDDRSTCTHQAVKEIVIHLPANLQMHEKSHAVTDTNGDLQYVSEYIRHTVDEAAEENVLDVIIPHLMLKNRRCGSGTMHNSGPGQDILNSLVTKSAEIEMQLDGE